MKCKFCGSKLPDNAVYCPGCGTKVSAAFSGGVPKRAASEPPNPVPQPPHTAAATKAPKKRFYQRWWFWVIIVIIGILSLPASSTDEATPPDDVPTSQSDSQSNTNYPGGTLVSGIYKQIAESSTSDDPQENMNSFVTPESVVYSGTGDDVITLAPFEGVYVFNIIGNSSNNHFSVKSYTSDGDYVDLLVNTTEEYNGTVVDDTQSATKLEISATATS